MQYIALCRSKTRKGWHNEPEGGQQEREKRVDNEEDGGCRKPGPAQSTTVFTAYCFMYFEERRGTLRTRVAVGYLDQLNSHALGCNVLLDLYTCCQQDQPLEQYKQARLPHARAVAASLDQLRPFVLWDAMQCSRKSRFLAHGKKGGCCMPGWVASVQLPGLQSSVSCTMIPCGKIRACAQFAHVRACVCVFERALKGTCSHPTQLQSVTLPVGWFHKNTQAISSVQSHKLFQSVTLSVGWLLQGRKGGGPTLLAAVGYACARCKDACASKCVPLDLHVCKIFKMIGCLGVAGCTFICPCAQGPLLDANMHKLLAAQPSAIISSHNDVIPFAGVFGFKEFNQKVSRFPFQSFPEPIWTHHCKKNFQFFMLKKAPLCIGFWKSWLDVCAWALKKREGGGATRCKMGNFRPAPSPSIHPKVCSNRIKESVAKREGWVGDLSGPGYPMGCLLPTNVNSVGVGGLLSLCDQCCTVARLKFRLWGQIPSFPQTSSQTWITWVIGIRNEEREE
eukprot:1160050-Pelagomonas_calceolata.AAC.1